MFTHAGNVDCVDKPCEFAFAGVAESGQMRYLEGVVP